MISLGWSGRVTTAAELSCKLKLANESEAKGITLCIMDEDSKKKRNKLKEKGNSSWIVALINHLYTPPFPSVPLFSINDNPLIA